MPIGHFAGFPVIVVLRAVARRFVPARASAAGIGRSSLVLGRRSVWLVVDLGPLEST